VLLAVAAASFVGGPALVDRVTALISSPLSASGQQRVSRMLTDTTGRGAASVVGFLALLWSATGLVRGLDRAFDEIYHSGVETSMRRQARNALVVLGGVGAAVGLVVGLAVGLSTLSVAGLPFDLLGPPSAVVVLTLVFLPIYYVLPPVATSVRGVLPGAAVAAVGWVVLQYGFRIYAANAGRYAAYGLIGGILLFLTWLYLASVVILLGAAVNAVASGVRVRVTSRPP
jgi:membrane protein